jgi:tol-pal system protein YbgF
MKNRERGVVPGLCAWLALASLSTLAGCVHEKGESQLVWLQSSLESEFPDRAIDLSGKEETRAPVTSPIAAPPPAAQKEPAVRVEPPPAEPVARVEDTTAASGASRPVIRVVGTGKPHGPGHPANDHIELTLPDERAAAAVTSAESLTSAKPGADPTAKQEYDRGLALLNARDYDHALEALQTFLMRWPDDPNVEAALYWTGECYLAKGEVVEAGEQFESALSRFPQGSKVPDELLKLGMSAQRLGNKEGARSYFDRLQRDYPKSDAARRIPHDHGATL